MNLLPLITLVAVSLAAPFRLDYCNFETKVCKQRGEIFATSEGFNFTLSSDISTLPLGSWVTARLHTNSDILTSSTPVRAPGLSTGEELSVFVTAAGEILGASLRQTNTGRFEVTAHSDLILPEAVLPEKIKIEEQKEEPSLIRKYWWAFIIGGILLSALISDNKQ